MKMVETNEMLLIVGNEEAVTLKPSNVKILSVETGEFGANMEVGLLNDGPVTILLDTEAKWG